MAEFFQLQKKGPALTPAEPDTIFPFLADGEDHVISIVGAGGKTTTMRFLAEEFTRRGKKTIEATTTHIANPGSPYFSYIIGDLKDLTDPDWMKSRLTAQLSRNWDAGLFVTVGTVQPSASGDPRGKLAILPGDLLEAVMDIAEVTLFEADGARRLPMKVPATHEPVIHPKTDAVVAVLGMNALGQKMNDVCCRLDEAEDLLGKSREEIVTEEDFAAIFLSENGARKGVEDRAFFALLNQCDDEARMESAARILAMLREGGVEGAASRHAQINST